MMRAKFNFWTRGYLRNSTPVALVRELASTPPGRETDNEKFEIRLKKKKRPSKGAQATDHVAGNALTAITFDPSHLTSIDLETPPAGEDWEMSTKTVATYGPEKRIVTEIPTSVLRKGLGEGFEALFEALKPAKTAKPTSKKRKVQDPPSQDSAGDSTPKRKKSQKPSIVDDETEKDTESTRSKKRRPQNASEASSANSPHVLPTTRPTFRRPYDASPSTAVYPTNSRYGSPADASAGFNTTHATVASQPLSDKDINLPPSPTTMRKLRIAALDRRKPPTPPDVLSPHISTAESVHVTVIDSDSDTEAKAGHCQPTKARKASHKPTAKPVIPWEQSLKEASTYSMGKSSKPPVEMIDLTSA